MRILLSRTDRIGDLILSTPAIATLRRSFPSAHIALACSEYNRVAVERNGDLDALHTLGDSVNPGRFGSRFRGQVDCAIALAPRTRDIALIAATRAPERIGYTYRRRYFSRLANSVLLTKHAVSAADPVLAEREHGRVRHEVEQLLDLVAMAGARRRVLDLRIDLRDEDRRAVAHLPAGAIVFQLAPRWLSGGSTLESCLALIRELRSLGRPLIAAYASDAAALGERVQADGVADVVAGYLPFYRWAALFERAACVVTVDTGATHVASAVGRPTVVVFEHRFFRLHSEEWAPYRVPHVVLRKPADAEPGTLARFRNEVVSATTTMLDA